MCRIVSVTMFSIVLGVALLSIINAESTLPNFISIKAPKEIISRYETVIPLISYKDGNKPHPKVLEITIHSHTFNFTLLLEMNEQLLPPHFTSRYYNKQGEEVVTKGHVNCFYHGVVEGHPNWKATMSTCHGLQAAFGDVHDENNYFHLEPLDPQNGSLEQVHALYLDSEYKHKGGACGSDHGVVPSGEDVVWPTLDKSQQNMHSRLRRQSDTRIVEWILVNDNRQYVAYNSNLTATVIRAISLANEVDALYRPINIRVVLIDVITWVNGDEITVSPDPNILLDSLTDDYRPRVTTPHDSLMLMTGIDITGSTVGFAFVGTMCSETTSVGLTQDGGRSLSTTASIAAHELGHIFNMNHDDDRQCSCVDSATTGCIMSATLGFPPPTQWSTCSISDLNEGYNDRNLDRCLFNEPSTTVGDPVCGNGIRERDEVCDCGSAIECTDPCCNASTCQLASGAQCSDGPCCNSTCQFVSYGTPCRNSSGVCDILEYCAGNSSDCPADVHRLDGTSCSDAIGYCYFGECPTYNAQCQVAFGSDKAEDVCYQQLNTRGDVFGNCGHNTTNYLPCSQGNVECGQLHCMDGDYQANVDVSVTILRATFGSDVCRSFTSNPGADVVSPGLVQDGTKCGTDQVCLSHACVPVSTIISSTCDVASNGVVCSGNGICNNHGNCSCDVGYTGSDCETQYNGPGDTTNMCDLNNGGCEQVCTSIQGVVQCSCNLGYLLGSDQVSCGDVNECGTANGNCTQLCNNTVGSFSCDCTEGYVLSDDGMSCVDVDECILNSHNCQHTCNNTVGGFVCSCNSGFGLNSDQRTCSDVDECAVNTDGCDQECQNTVGSFECACGDGYVLSGDGRTCLDINECTSGTHNCEQLCVNTQGGFICECNSGFQLNQDSRTCSDIDECTSSQNTHGCQQLCVNTEGGFRCDCNTGFQLNADNSTCSDINECANNSGGCNQVCNNTDGSFHCLCNDGYTLSEDGRTCRDINECMTNTHGCQQLCVNTEGGFRCECNNTGYQLNTDQSTCSDIDECATNASGCNQICNNTAGSFECSCRSGFTLLDDGRTCVEINECTLNTHDCQQECINVVGGFQCGCYEGYSLNSDLRTCSDVNECANNSGGCNQVCNNTDGSFHCLCNDGYTLSEDGRTCRDINECITNTHGCQQLCVNTEGGFRCECNTGYQLNDDSRTCTDIDECTSSQNTSTHDCQQLCVNTEGGFRCECNTGFQLNDDNNTCSDINECANNSGGCNQVCNNTDGSFHCLCNDGYTLSEDGRTCRDINECMTNTHGCQQVCVNTEGGFRCECNNTGYQLNTDQSTCSDIDECATNASGCNQICNNTAGSFECSCRSGFTLLDDGRTCVEIDECTLNTHNCQQECINVVGGFQCGCYEGYSLNSDLRTCSDVNECANNSGGCNQVCNNTDGSFHCLCNDGYTLSEDGRTCRDINECITNTHGCQQVCVNTEGGFRCECNTGYQLNDDSRTCTDIDECTSSQNTSTHDCQQLCVNTEGGFRCECNTGFQLNADNNTCSDIDECATNASGCNQICNNTAGSFECSCRSGFTLLDDGRTCVEINECTLNTDNCQQECINVVGGFRCRCYEGYSLNSDLRTCSDVNECANNSGGCNQVCNNTDGSFHCLCNDGYTLSEDGRTCRDINECMTNTHGCQQVCVNTEGGFRCECNNTGFQLNTDQSTCSDIDECETNTSNCDQICMNTIGSFECRCRSGFILFDDGRTCVEINECTLNTDNCQQECINVVGGFQCGCYEGYSLNSDLRTCSDINECANNSGGCNQVCNNTDGSFHCLCNDGYTLSEDGRTCRDINECMTNTHGCQQLCVNTEGGFRCECNTGFQLNDDSRTCTDTDECTIGRHDCQQLCVNTEGGFRCDCNTGYQLNADNSTCSDINECANNSGGCNQVCNNTDGSFHCLCNDGYTLSEDGKTCRDINECMTNTHGCQQLCVNTEGGFRCECNNTGYQLNADQSTCSDIDECATNASGCNQICNNTAGSFECSCRSGFTLLDDGRTCVEINECTLNTHNCQQECINVAGGFQCGCYEGYSLNSDLRTCSDVDECATNTTDCEQGCNNTIGSFSCTCIEGYTLSDDGKTCADVNECATRSHGCQQACVNTAGSYRCGCYFGYNINDDMKTCSDVNECETESNICDQACSNTMGSFQCICNEGYSLSSDGKTCTDINECALGLHNCQQGCINTIGQFRCTCFTGYQLNSDQTTCSGAGFVFSLLNKTDISLIEGSTQTLCIELIFPASLESIEQTRSIRVLSSGGDLEGYEVSVLRHEEVVTFSRDVDATHQRVSCISLSIDEDMVYSPGREYLLQFEVVESTDRFDGPSQVIIKIRENGIKFVDIIGLRGTVRLDLRSSDGHSGPIYFRNGIPIGRSTETKGFIGDNGVISFRRGFNYYTPDLFPTNRQAIRNSLVVAPFWSDIDVRLEGNIYFKQFVRTSGNEQDMKLFNFVSGFIANKQRNATNFTGNTMLVAQWKDVPPYPHGISSFFDQLSSFTSKRNTFQAIIISDGERTFAVFTYNCDMLEWTGQYEHAVVGYSVGEGVDDNFPRFDNYGLSGQSNVNLVACSNEHVGVQWSNLVYKIGDISGDVAQENRAKCLAKYQDDVENFGEQPISLASFVLPCPCSIFQAIRDRRFVFNFIAQPPSSNSYCFFQRFSSLGGAVQECCYSVQRDSFGSLLTQSDSSGSTGSMLLFHPFFLNARYLEYDLEFKTTCCYKSDRCSLYYERRPIDDCSSYFAPRFTWGLGDPHITTLDSYQYTFNGWGEYVLVKVENQFELQGRTTPVNNSNATMFSAFAFGINEATVEVQFNVSNGLEVLLNGTFITSDVGDVNETVSNAYVDISRSETNTITSSFYNGVSVTITLSSGILSFVAALPHDFMGQTKGLLGNFNGNDTDDLIFPNETLLEAGSTDRMIHSFGQTWEIEPSLSLFTYAEGMTAQSFSHPEHEPVFLDEVIESASDEILQLCGDNAECIFDAIQTGNTEVGLNTLESDNNNADDQMITSNDPPAVLGPSVFLVTIGEESYYTFSVTDDHNMFTLMVEGGLPDNATLHNDGSSYTLTWMLARSPQQLFDFNQTIQIIARDELNATSLIVPQIQICACGEGGNCTSEGVLNASVNPLILDCECSEAYSGRYCNEDVDGCAELSCFTGVECEDIRAPGVGAMCGDCPDGFDGNGMKCTDINECANNTLNNCQQICENTEGGFSCNCLPGYSLLNQTHCQDIDECADFNGGCHHLCINDYGSFYCSCNDGYELQQDNITCVVQASSFCSNTNECDQNCVLLDGNEICSCDLGYTLAEDSVTCHDVNECEEGVCTQLCNNTDGGFKCGCYSGFTLASDGRSCLDIDECMQAVLSGTQLCPNQMICSNTNGDYACLCPTGTSLVNGVCIEICQENYYRQPNTRCAACPSNSIRSTNDVDDVCSCMSGHRRQDETNINLPCLPVVGFISKQVTFSEDDDTHNEFISLALSAPSSNTITVTLTIYPATYMGLVSQQITFARGSTMMEVVVTVEGNTLATDGDQKFTASIDNGTNYIVGGTFGDDKYYTYLQIIVEEDDDLLPEFEANSVIVVLEDFSVETFTAEHQQQFKVVTADAVNAFCRINECGNFAVGQKKRQENPMITVTADDVVLRDIRDKQNQLELSMFILTNNDEVIISADVVLEAIETSKDLYAESGFTSLTATSLLQPTIPPESTGFSLLVIVGITVGAVVGLALLLLLLLVIYKCCRRCYRTSKNMPKRIGGDNYVVENPTYANASAPPAQWPHEETAVNIEKPQQDIGLQPLHIENQYVTRESEWATQNNL